MKIGLFYYDQARLWVAGLLSALFLSSCTSAIYIPKNLMLKFTISGPQTIISYVCNPFRVSATLPDGSAYVVKTPTTVTLDEIGDAAFFKSEEDCESNRSTSQIQLMPGTSESTFFVRSTQGSALRLSGKSSGFIGEPFAARSTVFDVLGQPDVRTLRQKRLSISGSYLAIANGRYYSAQQFDCRVLAWNAPPTSPLQAPDFVVLAPGLDTPCHNGPSDDQYLTGQPAVLATDGTRLVAAEVFGRRVWIWNIAPAGPNVPADILLNFPFEISSVAIHGGRLILVARYHSVMIWNSIPSSSATPPDVILGQPDGFSSAANNPAVPTAGRLNGPTFAATDGTYLYVADSQNHRILVWTSWPTVNGQAADGVIGQSTFTNLTANAGGAISGSGMDRPLYLHVYGSRLFAVDSNNCRVMGWSSLPTANTPASFILGKPDSTTGCSGITTSTNMSYPAGIMGRGTELWITDAGGNARTLIWDPIPSTTAAAATSYLAATSMNATTPILSTDGTTITFAYAVTSDGKRLAVADGFASRVLLWNNLPTTNNQAPDVVLGANTFNTSGNSGGANGFNLPAAMSMRGEKLFISQTNGNRISGYNSIPTANNAPADFILGQPDANAQTVNNPSIAAGMDHPTGVMSDGQRLFVADTNNSRVLVWNSVPSTSVGPDFALGQPDLNSNTANNPTRGANTLSYPSGVFSDGNRLVVTDYGNYRVLIWNTIPASFQQPADIVLGQADMSTIDTSGCNSPSAIRFCLPRDAQIVGTRLYVIDYNNRILVWNTIPTVDNQPADGVYGQPNLTSRRGLSQNINLAADTFNFASGNMGFYASPTRLFIADSDNYRITILPAF